jgi:hypothetical protein
VALERTGVSKEHIPSFIRGKIVREIGTTLAVTLIKPDDGGDPFVRNGRSYKSHTASHPRRGYSSSKYLVFGTGLKPVARRDVSLHKPYLASRNHVIYMQWVVCQRRLVLTGMCILVTLQCRTVIT